MEILLKNALIIDPQGKHNGTRKDILISGGKIQQIGSKVSSASAQKIKSENLHVSIGWMDIGTHLGEPGYEHRETTSSLTRAAIAGGFTAIAPFPNTNPPVQSASDLTFLQDQFRHTPLDLFPIACLSRGMEGREITEMKDLIAHGAIAFSDGLKGISSAGLMIRALQYISDNKIPVIDIAMDRSISPDGQMHEGEVSITLGLQGIPDIAELMRVQRNIAIQSYTGNHLVLHTLSGSRACQEIREARKTNGQIHATVSYLNLVADHNALEDFAVNYKVNPPLKGSTDRQALYKAVKEGTIQAIVSNHFPLEVEKKMLEFPYASEGATGLETCFPALCTKLGAEELETVIKALSLGPRQILNVPVPEIKKGADACLTLFDPDIEWTFEKSHSLSVNNPFLGKQFKGKVIGIINKGKTELN